MNVEVGCPRRQSNGFAKLVLDENPQSPAEARSCIRQVGIHSNPHSLHHHIPRVVERFVGWASIVLQQKIGIPLSKELYGEKTEEKQKIFYLWHRLPFRLERKKRGNRVWGMYFLSAVAGIVKPRRHRCPPRLQQ